MDTGIPHILEKTKMYEVGDYVRVEKVSTQNNLAPIPIGSSFEGVLLSTPVRGGQIGLSRRKRNGISIVGVFTSSPITGLKVSSIRILTVTTENSTYTIERAVENTKLVDFLNILEHRFMLHPLIGDSTLSIPYASLNDHDRFRDVVSLCGQLDLNWSLELPVTKSTPQPVFTVHVTAEDLNVSTMH